MGASSSILDDSKISYIRGRTEAELKNFSPHYRRQSCIAFFYHLKDEVEQHRIGQNQLLKQKEPLQFSDVLYKESVVFFDDNKKWKERFVVVCSNYSLEIYESQEAYAKGTSPRHSILPAGGAVLTAEEKYNAIIDKDFPDPNGYKEEPSLPVVVVPGPLPVYLRLPYSRDSYFCFQQEESRTGFISILKDCIRHQNQDYSKSLDYEVRAFLKALQFYRQEKGHYESWDMLVGTDCQVLANLVMEELLPSLQTELLPKLKGKKTERKRVWFATVEATYDLVQDQLREGFETLKIECRNSTKQQEALIRSDMDQIIDSQNFLKTKLQGLVSEQAMRFCTESVSPYLSSILEELMGPVSTGFQAVRLLLEDELTQVCKDFTDQEVTEELIKAVRLPGRDRMDDCYRHVSVLKKQLQELRNRFKFSNSARLVHYTQSQMQQLMENTVYTFGFLLQSALKDKPDKQALVMEKAKLRVLKQFDYDSSTVRKKIFQEALVDVTLPAIRRNLAPGCKTELQNFEQFIFADYTNFVQVENIYEDILLNLLNNEVNKVVKEAASQKKNNLFADSTDLNCISQNSLADTRTPPLTAPSSPPKVLASVPQQPEKKNTSPAIPIVKIIVSSPESEDPTPPSYDDPGVTSQPVDPEVSSTPHVKPDIPVPERLDLTTLDLKSENVSSAEPTSTQLSEDKAEPLFGNQSSDTILIGPDQGVSLISVESPPSVNGDPECLGDGEDGGILEVASEKSGSDALVAEDIDSTKTSENNSGCDKAPASGTDCPNMEACDLDSVCESPVGGAVGLTTHLEKPSSGAGCTNPPDTDEAADGVKAIRDLIMEVIEVEEIVRPCVEN